MKRSSVIIVLIVLGVLGCTLMCACGWIVWLVGRDGDTGFDWGVLSGSGQVIEREYQVSGITGVRLASPGTLYIELGAEESLRIEAKESLLRRLQIDAKGGLLEIETKPVIGLSFQSSERVKFYLTVTQLDTIDLAGSGNIEASDLEGDRVSVVVSGSGDIHAGNLYAREVKMGVSGSGNLTVEAVEADGGEVRIGGSGDVSLDGLEVETFEATITGSGNLTIAGGQVAMQSIKITGSGDYQASDLASHVADVHILGSGSVTVRVSERLDADITGSGDVRYYGSPAIEKSTLGSGRVRPMGE